MNFENVTAAVSMTVLLAYAASAVGQSPDMALTYVSPGAPPVECFARVNYDLNATLPGYLVQDAAGQACVPFSYRGQFVPPDYDGDYFAAEFTDSKIKERYGACMRERTCRERLATMQPLVIVPSELRATGAIDPAAKVDPHSVVDLRKIRRPAYFGHARYREPIAEAEERTYTVEFEVPREAYERVQIGRTDPVKLRGWYLEGSGIRDAEGRATRAVIVWIGGRTIETTAIQAPNELRYQYDEATTAYVARSFPNATSEQWGARAWRNYAYELNRAGFDVVTFDKRGHGISGGYNDVNTLEQARDMWRVLDALETGVGLEALSPSGELLAGNAVRGRFLAGLKAKEIPVIFGGSSQGSIATAWAMHQNFVEDCSFDLPELSCAPAHGYNVKAALLLASVVSGVSGRPAPVDVEGGALDEGRSRVERNVVMLPSSEPLAGIGQWPAVFFAKGLWDFAESLEATFDAYRRVTGMKELVVVRAPHAESDFGQENTRHVTERMVAFARAAVLGQTDLPGAARFADLKELVATSPPYWEPSSAPAVVGPPTRVR